MGKQFLQHSSIHLHNSPEHTFKQEVKNWQNTPKQLLKMRQN